MTPILSTILFLVAVLAVVKSQPYNYPMVPGNVRQEVRTVPFGVFEAQVEVEDAEFEVRGTFTLGASTNGINLFKEDVTFDLGGFSKRIPAGAFKQEKRGKLRYAEAQKESILDVVIRIVGNNKFSIKIEGEGLKLPKTVRPEDITLRIGDDEGRATPRPK